MKNSHYSSEESVNLEMKIFSDEQMIKEIESEKYKEYDEFIKKLSDSLINAKSFKDFETEIMRLSPDQQSIYDFAVKNIVDDCGQNLLVKGGPGTGKTFLLIKLLNYYIAQDKSPILLTYYDSLSKYIKFQYKLINETEGRNVGANYLRTYLKSFYDFMENKIKDSLGIEKIFKMEEEDSASIKKAKFKFIEKYGQEGEILFSESYNKIWPNLLTCESYKNNYEESQSSKYQDYWDKIQNVQNELKELNECLDRFAYYRFCMEDDIPIAEKRDYILIDETQDLTNAQLSAVKKLCRHSCIYVGDMNQSIRNSRVSWKSIGVYVNANYSKKLASNYRSTVQIQNLGREYLKNCNNRDDDDLNADAHSFGPKPVLINSSESEIKSKIVESVKFCRNKLNIALGNICIVSFSNEELFEIKELLQAENIDSDRISEDYEFGDEKVRLSTVKYIKGIDCPVLLFLADSRYISEDKSGIDKDNLANSIYTCITRAMYFLQLFVTEESKNIDEIKNLVNLIKNNSIKNLATVNPIKLKKIIIKKPIKKVVHNSESENIYSDFSDVYQKFEECRIDSYTDNEGNDYLYSVIEDLNTHKKIVIRDEFEATNKNGAIEAYFSICESGKYDFYSGPIDFSREVLGLSDNEKYILVMRTAVSSDDLPSIKQVLLRKPSKSSDAQLLMDVKAHRYGDNKAYYFIERIE